MQRDLYADAVGEITVMGGVVRIDFVTLSATRRGEDGRPVAEFSQRVVLPLPGFLNAFGAMDRVMQQLIERGVVTRQGGAPQAAASDNTSETITAG